MQEELQAIAASPVFSALDPGIQLTMVRGLTPEQWRKGSEIRIPGNAGRHFRLIVHGRVKVVASNPQSGRELSLRLLGLGDVLDCIEVLEQQQSSMLTWALDDVRTLLGYGALFREWVDRFPAFRAAVHHYIARQMGEVCALASDLALCDTRARLARLLLRHLDSPDEVTAIRINLIRGLSHEELASLIGSTRVVISRLLGELRRDEIVDIRKGSLRILDRSRLQQRAMA